MDPEGPDQVPDAMAERKRIIAGRNRVLALVLLALVALFFAITIVKMK
ncbi:MAG TPA: hypothetical protein VFV30_10530 [Novosphingobium sp.]|nr:hypothetical protein [Novosphingobium sp.]